MEIGRIALRKILDDVALAGILTLSAGTGAAQAAPENPAVPPSSVDLIGPQQPGAVIFSGSNFTPGETIDVTVTVTDPMTSDVTGTLPASTPLPTPMARSRPCSGWNRKSSLSRWLGQQRHGSQCHGLVPCWHRSLGRQHGRGGSFPPPRTRRTDRVAAQLRCPDTHQRGSPEPTGSGLPFSNTSQ